MEVSLNLICSVNFPLSQEDALRILLLFLFSDIFSSWKLAALRCYPHPAPETPQLSAHHRTITIYKSTYFPWTKLTSYSKPLRLFSHSCLYSHRGDVIRWKFQLALIPWDLSLLTLLHMEVFTNFFKPRTHKCLCHCLLIAWYIADPISEAFSC